MELVEPQGPAAEIDEAERQRKTGHDDHGNEFAARQCTYLRELWPADRRGLDRIRRDRGGDHRGESRSLMWLDVAVSAGTARAR